MLLPKPHSLLSGWLPWCSAALELIWAGAVKVHWVVVTSHVALCQALCGCSPCYYSYSIKPTRIWATQPSLCVCSTRKN